MVYFHTVSPLSQVLDVKYHSVASSLEEIVATTYLYSLCFLLGKTNRISLNSTKKAQ
jgi:hypothetical protein